jgi:hypothetical protein
MKMNITRKWRLPAMLVGGLIAAAAAISPVQAAGSSPAIPAATASKLESSPKLSKLWADPSARTSVIVRFDMPAVAPASSFSSPAEADAAQTSAIHAVQDKILASAFGSVLAGPAADAHVLKRMSFSPMFAINASASEIEALAANPLVTLVQADRVSKPMLDNALPVIGMPAAYTAGATGTGWSVAVLDTGARRTHKFLNAHITHAACFSTTNPDAGQTSLCPGGANATTIDSGANCPVSLAGCEHGSHVSGIAAGLNANRLAGEPLNGAARDGRLISIQVFTRVAQAQCGANATADCTSSVGSDQILALEHVFSLRNTVQIAAANMSLGSDEGFAAACDNDPLKPIIDQLRAAGIATVIAAGNESRDAAVGSPSCITSAITVAATDNQDVRAPFSNWGNQIDLVAPGVDIISSVITSDSAFAPSSGTSMATPMVAGVFAAIKTVRPNATVDQIETALKNTGTGITAAGVTKPRINVPQAIAAIPNRGGTATLLAAVTPVARATAVNGTVTAFATILNTSANAGNNCSIALPAGTLDVTFSYSGRNPTTGAPENPDTPVTIPANSGYNFVMSFTPTAVQQTNIALVFSCANAAAAPSQTGLNTFLLTATAGAPADLVSIAVTATNDGIANVPLGGTGFAALAAINIGTTANLQARLDANAIGLTGKTLAAALSMCQTNSTTGACLAPPSATVDFTLNNQQTATFSAFIQSNGTPITFDPANTRLFVHFFQGTDAVGSASVAVRTVAAAKPALAMAD